MVMKLSTVFLPAVLVLALLQLESTAKDETADVERSFLKNSTFWRNVVLRSDTSGLVDINDFLVGVIENFREDMTTGIPDLKVPVLDPFRPPKPIKIDVEDKTASVHGNFTKLEVQGFSGFSMDRLNANLHDLALTFALRIPRIYASGCYIINGKIIKIVPLRGNGTFWIESKNLTLSASASMETTDDGYLQLSKDFDVHIDFDQVQMDFENLLGGGKWTEILKQILNDMSKGLFIKFLPQLKGELNKALLKVINQHLMKLPIKSIMPGSTANEYVDQILSNVRQFIRDKNYDPMALPDYHTNFSKEVVFITMHGEAKLYDGLLSGVSSIHRTDECALNSTSKTIALSAHLGLKDLRVHYKGHAKFMNWGPSIECGGSIADVSFFFSVEQSNKRGATPHLRDLEIVEMSTIWIELSGLGPLTWIMKWLLTGISKLVEDFVVVKVTEYLTEYLQDEFQKVSFPV